MPAHPFAPEQYPAFAAFLRQIEPESAPSAAELETEDQREGSPRRWLWSDEHGVHAALVLHPKFGAPIDHFYLEVLHHPQAPEVTLLDALLGVLEQDLEGLVPCWVFSMVDEGNQPLLAFFARHGFQEIRREHHVELDLRDFDTTPFAAAAQQAATQGYSIRSLAELQDDPQRDQKVYQLDLALRREVPGSEEFDQPFEAFAEQTFESPAFRPDSYFIALHGEQYVGLHRIWVNPTGPRVGLTGLLPGHRRQGVASALKLRGVSYAQAHGFLVLRAENDADNEAILDLNRRMGYRKRGGAVEVMKHTGVS